MRALPLLALLALLACARLPAALAPAPEPLHLADLAGEGDAERRTSMRLVLQGLDADSEGRPDLARGGYENALRVDPSNPYAYLALARYHAEGASPERALSFLDRTSALLEAQGARSPRVEPHLEGLRGAALLAGGRAAEARPHLERARALAPSAWNDGRLSARELR